MSVKISVSTLSLKEDIVQMRHDLRQAVRSTIKWMFFFAVSQVLVTWLLFALLVKR